MNRQRLIGYCAAALAVDQPGSVRLWLLRLFVLPEPLQPSWLRRQFQLGWIAGCEILIRELGIDQPRRLRNWLWRLMVKPRPNWQPIWQHRLARGLDDWLWPLLASRVQLAARSLEALDQRIQVSDRPRLLVLGILIFIATILSITTPMDNGQQTLFFLLLWLVALGLGRFSGPFVTVALVALSLLTTFRYANWRITDTMLFDDGANLFFGYGLLAAEAYTWMILLLSYIQTILPLQRQPAALPADQSAWPSVDLYIPTYNEPLSVVRTTVFAAQGVDWPREKLKIFILDDGRRDEFRAFADQVGVGYITRPDNFHAKAGNLNHAMTKTDGEYIAIFDCDHVPTRSFLTQTMGWFLRNPKCALVQTPHHFFSPDPFERNLDNFGEVPNENYLFHRMVQDGNDLWNAAFFCGSCAVLKRGPLLEVGGVAVETVTEDAHTALKLHRLGYESVYINIPLAAGLATESLSGHIGQRIRWARGMVQIFRIDNPWLGKGLTLFQRICYSTAMIHFLMGIPRLVFLTAPLAYMFFELHIIHTRTDTLALYALPYLTHASIAKAKMQGVYRHSFWADVYDTVLAWYITPPTTLALINPKYGKFNVTPKGGLVEQSFFDWSISKPYLLLIGLNMLGLLVGFCRMIWWNSHEIDVVLLNTFWTLINLTILGATLRVADEARQVRTAHRVPVNIPVIVFDQRGHAWHCQTFDYSSGGIGLILPGGISLELDERVDIVLSRGNREYSFAAKVVVCREQRVGVVFDEMSLEQERNFAQCTFARADAWSDWHQRHEQDHPLKGFMEVVNVAWDGYRHLLLRAWQWSERTQPG